MKTRVLEIVSKGESVYVIERIAPIRYADSGIQVWEKITAYPSRDRALMVALSMSMGVEFEATGKVIAEFG